MRDYLEQLWPDRLQQLKRAVEEGCSYSVVEPPHRVVFSWGDAGSTEPPLGSSRLEVDLEQVGDQTQVTLRHRGLTWAVRADHARG